VFRWTTSADEDVSPVGEALPWGAHAWRHLTGADGWLAAGQAAPCPEPLSYAQSTAYPESMRVLVDAFAKTRDPWEIAKRFPNTMAGNRVPGVVFLAHWNGFHMNFWTSEPESAGYPATRDELNRMSEPRQWGWSLSVKAFGWATTDSARTFCSGPLSIRRHRSPGGDITQVGVFACGF
jgi:hypothetical protein